MNIRKPGSSQEISDMASSTTATSLHDAILNGLSETWFSPSSLRLDERVIEKHVREYLRAQFQEILKEEVDPQQEAVLLRLSKRLGIL